MKNNQTNQLYRDWDKFWERENVTILGRIMTKARMQIYRETIDELDIKTAIDIGCGFGLVLQIFQEAGLDCEGIDVSPNSVEFCKKKGLRAKLGKLEEEKKQYDLVESEGMLEHFLNFEPYVAHLTRISCRYVMIMQPNHDSFWGRTLVYFARLLRSNVLMFEYNYRMKDFIDVFDRYGFKIVKNQPVFFNTSRLLLFEKK